MSVSLGVLIVARCILCVNGGSFSSQTTYTTSSLSPNFVSTVNLNVNKSNSFNNTYLRLFHEAVIRTKLRMFEKGFDFNETEKEKFKIWPDGEIPYFLDLLSFDLEQEYKIIDIFEKYNKLTGLNFFPIDEAPEEDNGVRWVLFANRKGYIGCMHYTVDNFTNDSMQRVILGWNCLSAGDGIAPLIMALAGVPAQHNSPDRDEYIEIIWENIFPEKKPLFTKLNNSDWLFHDMKYDFGSAGHFPNNLYSLNGKATFKVIKNLPFERIDNENLGLSYSDIKKIKMLYNYVSRNRTNPVNETRRSLHNYGIDIVDDGSPRVKPNRYLGVPDPTIATTPATTTSTMSFRRRRKRRRRRKFEKMPTDYIDDMVLFIK